MNHQSFSLEINNRTLSIEINKVATQADGSALIRYGDTVMFVSATSKRVVKEKMSVYWVKIGFFRAWV